MIKNDDSFESKRCKRYEWEDMPMQIFNLQDKQWQTNSKHFSNGKCHPIENKNDDSHESKNCKRYDWEDMPMRIHKGKTCCDDNCHRDDKCCCATPCDIKQVLEEIDEVEHLLRSPKHGLAEIKTEVAATENAVLNPMFGLARINSEVLGIQAALSSPIFGLEEIKTEVYSIENAIYNPTYGLEEIKTEIYSIQNAIFNPTFGLEEIRTEIVGITDRLDSPNFGLEEIQTEVNQLLDFLQGGNKTTGPVVASIGTASVVINLFNNTNSAKTVSATLFELTTTGKNVVFTTGPVLVLPQSSNGFETPVVPVNYEVEFTGLVQGVYGWTSARTVFATGAFIAANTFRHSELVTINS